MKVFNLISKGSAILLKLNIVLSLLLLFNHPASVFSLPSSENSSKVPTEKTKAVVEPGNDLERSVYGFEFLSYRADQSEKTYLEMFGQISTNDLIFVKSKNGFVASYELSITVYDQLNNAVVETIFIDSLSVKTIWDVDRYRPPQLLHFPVLLKPGEYKACVRFTDRETRLPWDFEKNVTVADFNTSDLGLSELQIPTSITLSNETSGLVKKVVPNVGRIVEVGSDEMHVYSEIYNLQNTSNEPKDEFTATYVIENAKEEEVRSFQLRCKKPGDTCALSVTVPVGGLAEGEYRLILTVEDPAQVQKVRKSTEFYVVRPFSGPYM
jgi:hypothetical protein